jgi:hypothetical protein
MPTSRPGYGRSVGHLPPVPRPTAVGSSSDCHLFGARLPPDGRPAVICSMPGCRRLVARLPSVGRVAAVVRSPGCPLFDARLPPLRRPYMPGHATTRAQPADRLCPCEPPVRITWQSRYPQQRNAAPLTPRRHPVTCDLAARRIAARPPYAVPARSRSTPAHRTPAVNVDQHRTTNSKSPGAHAPGLSTSHSKGAGDRTRTGDVQLGKVTGLRAQMRLQTGTSTG